MTVMKLLPLSMIPMVLSACVESYPEGVEPIYCVEAPVGYVVPQDKWDPYMVPCPSTEEVAVSTSSRGGSNSGGGQVSTENPEPAASPLPQINLCQDLGTAGQCISTGDDSKDVLQNVNDTGQVRSGDLTLYTLTQVSRDVSQVIETYTNSSGQMCKAVTQNVLGVSKTTETCDG